MVREIIKDTDFLSQKSAPATIDDMPVALDLLDTLEANRDRCVGLAANMIGELKCIIVFDNGGTPCVMFNPKILKTSGKYLAEESCLSLDGKRVAHRFENIQVRYKDMDFKSQIRTFSAFTAEIVQHEIDHCNGKII